MREAAGAGAGAGAAPRLTLASLLRGSFVVSLAPPGSHYSRTRRVFVKRWTRARAAAARRGAGAAAVTSLPVRTFKIESSFYADLVSGVFLSGFVEKAVRISASGIRLDL